MAGVDSFAGGVSNGIGAADNGTAVYGYDEMVATSRDADSWGRVATIVLGVSVVSFRDVPNLGVGHWVKNFGYFNCFYVFFFCTV